MLLGTHASTDRVSIITEADELLDVGTFNIANTTPLYKAAQAWFSQIPRPTKLYIGKRNTGEAIGTALPACAVANNEWYGFVDVTHAVSDTLLAAAWAEANNKLYLTVIAEAGALTTATDDLASSLQDGNFFRTAWWYHSDLAQFPDVATAAKAFAAYPGGGGQLTSTRQFFSSDLWSERRLAGVTVTPLTETQFNNMKLKNGNSFEPFRNLNLTQRGMTAGGEWLDVIRGRDWLCEEIRTRAFLVFVERRIPYTDVGIAIIARGDHRRAGPRCAARLARTGRRWTRKTTACRPTQSRSRARRRFPSVDKAARILRDVGFTARLAGAILAVEIVGVLTYERIAQEAA